jgi:pimeloyl-ACP methyl ester carboxylesterase
MKMFTTTRLSVLSLSILVNCIVLAQEPADISINRDGIILKGKFYQAKGDGPIPTLILLQGSPGNQRDVIGLGNAISTDGINALTFNYTGTHLSQGYLTFPNCLDDISAVYRFLRSKENIEKFAIDTSRIFLSGYSFGGGMAMTYTIKHREVKSVISIAGVDWGEYFEDYMKDSVMKAGLDASLQKSVEAGITRFEPGKMPGEMGEEWLKNLDPAFYTKRNAKLLADKNLLIICGWDDPGITLERYVLPLYRELKKNPGQKISVVAFQDDHSFGKSRPEIAQIISDWIRKKN